MARHGHMAPRALPSPMTGTRPRRPSLRPPYQLGPMPAGRPMETVDQQLVRANVRTAFEVVRHVEEWPAHLSHYRYVRFREYATAVSYTHLRAHETPEHL